MTQRYKDARAGHAQKVLDLIASFEAPHILELGGGRSPRFDLTDLPNNVASYTVNDIDASELEKAPAGYKTACFDVCGDVSEFSERYDIVFSQMLAEHVSDGEKLHRNSLKLLRAGGVVFHYMPKLYTVPFVLNWLLPEKLSQRILWFFFPQRRSEKPKFPAVYSWCKGSTGRIEKRILSLGYSDVMITPFFGHSYYRSIPVLKQIEQAMSDFYMQKKWSVFATFMYVIARK